jgi:tetratricopeptide (TPR) repeat protein
MGRADDAMEPLPPEPTPIGWFEPTPERVEAKLAATRARYREQSVEYAALLDQLGDAHMKQGCLSNPAAQASYEAALEIFRTKEEKNPEIAWLYDKLSCVKQSSGDTVGAQADLEKALVFWKDHPPENALAPTIRKDHVARRQEDWQSLKKVNDYRNRKPPPIDPPRGESDGR